MAQYHSPTQRVLMKQSVAPLAITAAATNGSSVDCLGSTRTVCEFDSAPSGTGTTSTCKLLGSPDNSTFTDIPSASQQATTAGGTAKLLIELKLDGSAFAGQGYRYLRAVHTGAGGSAAGAAAASIHLYGESFQPVAQDNAVVMI